MKRNWEYKKLGEVCDYPNQRIAIKDLCVGEYVGVENLVKNRGGLVQSTVMPDADNSIEFHVGDVLIGNIRPYLRKIWLADFNGGASGDVVVVRVKKEFGNKLQPSYLYKVLSSEKFFEYDNSNTKGAKMPRGDRNIIAKYLIPVPPLEEQSRIVAELDLLTGIIDKQKAQLKELDNLAQSIFYDMFGDPIENPKGWEVKKFDELCVLITDGEHATPKRCASGIYLLSARNVHNHHLVLDDVDFIDDEEYSRISKRIVPQKGDVLISCSGSVGRVCVAPDIKFQMVRSVALLRLDETRLNTRFFEYLVCSDYVQKQIDDSKVQVAQANLFQGRIKALKGILPPLSLQQSFAEKIQSIEKQKETIRASIADTQKLLDYTMDKYFG